MKISNKTKIYFFLLVFIFFGVFSFAKSSWAATLFEANWDVGTACTETNIKSGAWTGNGGSGAGVCSNACNCYGIGTGGPGGKNYLKILEPSSGSGNINGSSLGNPSTMYVRFWFRWTQWANSMHYVWLNSSTNPSSGICLLRGFDQTFSIAPGISGVGDRAYYWTSNLTLNQWYRLEFKITGGGSSNGAVLVRLDGVDITSQMQNYVDMEYLSTYNGNLTIPSLTNINVETYDHPEPGEVADVAGLKITNGPDWIGDDSSACICTSWVSGSCGAGGCSSNQRQQTRTCTPSGCNTTAQCVTDSSCGTTKTGDLNNDNRVDVIDLGIFLSNWGSTSRPSSDLNSDGYVNVIDLGILLSNWG
jgi:hypothetical protein